MAHGSLFRTEHNAEDELSSQDRSCRRVRPGDRRGCTRRWAALKKEMWESFVDDQGLLDEFAFMYAVRDRFPLHYTVFRQTASHLPHEANVEQVFSRSGLLTDPNMNPDVLSVLVRIVGSIERSSSQLQTRSRPTTTLTTALLTTQSPPALLQARTAAQTRCNQTVPRRQPSHASVPCIKSAHTSPSEIRPHD